jgi:hypothetical protein
MYALASRVSATVMTNNNFHPQVRTELAKLGDVLSKLQQQSSLFFERLSHRNKFLTIGGELEFSFDRGSGGMINVLTALHAKSRSGSAMFFFGSVFFNAHLFD